MSSPVDEVLRAEQEYVDECYDCLDRGLADREQSFNDFRASDLVTRRAMGRALEILRQSRGSGQLVFGRFDADGESMYVGRRRVHDSDAELKVVGWHAPAARRFYESTSAEPLGLELKRVFSEENRKLKRVFDEITTTIISDGADAIPIISDALINELERSRDGAMREVVATIQAEQHRIIRADPDRVLVVDGGPGTGKTVVGLHRAAWLTFNHEDLRRAGILVVSPNTSLLTYTSGVLPSLEAASAFQVELGTLYVGDARAVGSDPEGVARVKGSAQMSMLLRGALRSRIGWTGDSLELSLGGERISVPGEQIARLVTDIAARSSPYLDGRETFRSGLSALAFRTYTERLAEIGRPVAVNEAVVRRLSAFTNALDRTWPTFTPEDFLRSLYGTQSWLVDAAEGVLNAEERASLFREPAARIEDEPWTRSDLFCLDELAGLLQPDVRTYGHIVVDEAQDLSPMEARALARRCPTGSFTVLGDLAQATGAWVRDSWWELTEHLGAAETDVQRLTIGYRVPASVLDLAAGQLPLIAPGLVAPQSVRRGYLEPQIVRSSATSLLGDALDRAEALRALSLTTAIVVAADRYDAVLALALDRGIDVGDGRDGDFSQAVTAVPAELTKGLEFDGVVLVEPAELVDLGAWGRRLLYVAMTRCTQQLTVVHAAALPAGLSEPDPGPVAADDREDEQATQAEGSSAQLSARHLRSPGSARAGDVDERWATLLALDEADQELVWTFVRRLASPTPGTADDCCA